MKVNTCNCHAIRLILGAVRGDYTLEEEQEEDEWMSLEESNNAAPHWSNRCISSSNVPGNSVASTALHEPKPQTRINRFSLIHLLVLCPRRALWQRSTPPTVSPRLLGCRKRGPGRERADPPRKKDQQTASPSEKPPSHAKTSQRNSSDFA